MPVLTPQQLAVARLYVRGERRQGIAVALGIAPGTVKRHLEAIGARLDGPGTLRARVLAHLLTLPDPAWRLSA